MIAFFCFALSAAALYYIFHLPLIVLSATDTTRAAYLRERKEAVYENLRDLNFEFNAGKLPVADYEAIKSSLEEEAAAILAEISRLEGAVPVPVKEPKRT